MSKLADAGSRRTIEDRLDLNILVEAGAGSGKTHSLANRMAAGIVSGRYEVEHLAAVTFTRKAAAELRGRFQLALEKRLRGADGSERARIERALASLEHLFAGTIHSFCAHLLRERPVEAGIAPGFSELDELEDEELTGRAWRDYLARLRGERSPLLHDLQRARVSAKDLDRAFRTVCNFDEVDFPPGDAVEPDIEAVRKATEVFWEQLQALMPKPPDPGNKCGTLERARKFRGLLRSASNGRPADLAEALQCWENPPKVTMKWWAEDTHGQRVVRAKVEELVSEFHVVTVRPFLSAWRQYVYRLAMTLLTGAREFARGERRRALKLNYGDLLSAAAALLRNNPLVRAALQRKYLWLLVDEFQDTDPIQAEVMLLLAADEDCGDGVAETEIDPYAVRLRPGALFVVGDPKQSIYRFRRADIDVYNRVRETVQRSGGKVVPLTTSFRARPSLCQWNNEAFSRLLPSEATPHQAAFRPLDPAPAWKPQRPSAKGERGLRTVTVPDDVARGRVAGADAEIIARYIRAEVDAKAADWADFLVLTRKKKQLHVYAAALQALRVPTEVTGAGAFGGSPVVRALVGLLRALGDPGDALAVVGVLRGPLFGISDRQLFEHRQAGGYFSLSAGQGSRNGNQPSPVAAALERLGALLRLTRSLPLPSAVERLVEDTGFLALAASAEGAGPASAGDVLHAVDLVRAAAESGGSLADTADALEQAAASSEVESVPLEPGQRNVVRVMNLHKAKGLEARVVFLVDPLGAPKKSADVRIVREGAAARGYLALRKEVGEHGSQLVAHPDGWEVHEAAEMAYVLAEEARLLYVAATRARELLVVSRWEKDAKGRPWEALDEFLEDVPELAVRAAKPGTEAGKVDLSAAARAEAAGARATRRELACRPSWDATSVTGADLEGEKAAGGKARGGKSTAPRADAGAAWGSLVHGLLEYAGRHPDATRTDFERLARWLAVDAPELSAVAGDAVDLVEQVIHAPFWKDVQAGGEALVEVPFAVRLGAGESLGGAAAGSVPAILHGVIDLVHRAGEGWRILDYKTDVGVDDATLVARHGGQLATYRAVWGRVTGDKVTDSAVVALRSLRIVNVDSRRR